MHKTPKLPAAVAYLEYKTFTGFDDQALHGLIRECDEWFVWMDAVRKGFLSRAGQTEWDILTRKETIDVIDVHDRLEAELRARRRRRERPIPLRAATSGRVGAPERCTDS